ncbi:ABC transporter permease [Hahella sp. SMD15-11]|uniref:ABC transporter permease n=1 Tax=Thermohahella caldifontis TaxID=3142973 RepID=A0AB39UYS0_9GAMM
MTEWLEIIFLTLDATLRVSAPLIFCALAGLVSERSGVIDISLEGKLLAGAFVSATIAAWWGSPWLALVMAMLVTIALSLLHGLACITYRGNQVVSGVAINILVAGLTVVLGHAWFKQGGSTPPLSNEARFMPIDWPFAEALQDVPVIGLLYSELLSGHNLLVYVAWLTVPAVAWLLYQTRFGLRLRAVGENPQAVDTAGISVAFLRYRALIINGLLTGMAGTYLAIAQNAAFSRDMSAGQGYIALAAMIFGKWKPWPTFFAALLFGMLDAISIRLQGVVVPGIGEIPVQLIQALPYILTVVLLAGFIGKAVAPAADGVPYVKER